MNPILLHYMKEMNSQAIRLQTKRQRLDSFPLLLESKINCRVCGENQEQFHLSCHLSCGSCLDCRLSGTSESRRRDSADQSVVVPEQPAVIPPRLQFLLFFFTVFSSFKYESLPFQELLPMTLSRITDGLGIRPVVCEDDVIG